MIIGPMIITSVIQSKCMRIFDRAFSKTEDGRLFKGWAIILRPWLRDGDFYKAQKAVVIGWRRKMQDVRQTGGEWTAPND